MENKILTLNSEQFSKIQHGAKVFQLGDIFILSLNKKKAIQKHIKKFNKISNKELPKALELAGMNINQIRYLTDGENRNEYFERDFRKFVEKNLKEITIKND